jgi:hypothetical protein
MLAYGVREVGAPNPGFVDHSRWRSESWDLLLRTRGVRSRFWTAPDLHGARLYDGDRLIAIGGVSAIARACDAWNEEPPEDPVAAVRECQIGGSSA